MIPPTKMSDVASNEPRERSLPRIGLAALSLTHALVFAWLAVVLPWHAAYAFSVPVGALAALHLGLAGAALLRRRSLTLLLWALVAYLSCAGLALLTWLMLSTALYLSNLYGGVGQAVATGLGTVWCVLALFSLPISLWGFALGARLPLRVLRRWLPWGGGAAASLFVLSLLLVARSAHAKPTTARDPRIVSLVRDTAARALARPPRDRLASARPESKSKSSETDDGPAREPKRPRKRQRAANRPLARCAQPVGEAPFTLLVSEAGAPTACLQQANAEGLARALEAHLTRSAPPPSQVRLDLVTGVHQLRSVVSLVDALKLRPARDGVCATVDAKGTRCLPPWLLAAQGRFTSYRPLDAVADAGFGVRFDELRRMLGKGFEKARLERIETQRFVASPEGVVDLQDEPTAALPPKDELRTAGRLAAAHIVRAQGENGSFRYTLDPYTGMADDESVNVARHAGTTLVLCELGQGRRTNEAARKAARFLLDLEKRVADLSVFSLDGERAQLGHTALSLAALVTCRPRLEGRYDDVIRRAGRTLLRLQRADGSFAPALELSSGEPVGTRQGLYAAGQAVLALVLLEAWERPDARAPLHEAAERAMRFYGGPYWRGLAYDFFFLEENWHCLAARAALAIHRNDAYERFCLDYVTFKSRFIQDGEPGVPDGSYGLSPLFPPHVTPTAGFGEALAASLAVRRARGDDSERERELLGRVLSFLVQQQWREEHCFACARPKSVLGGFSESAASPLQRIDYTQHAWAALGHGARELALGGD